MKFSITQILIAMTFVFWSLSYSYSQNQTDKKVLSDQSNGYQFTAPSGFDSAQSEGGFTLINDAKNVVLVVKSHNYSTFQQFASELNLEKDGFKLVDKIQDFGVKNKTLRASKQTAQGFLIADTFVIFSPYRGGVIVVALTDAQNAENGFNKALEVSNSINFSKPVNNPANNQLEDAFRGKHLLYLYTASGFSERTDIYLCPSGAFIYRVNSSSLSANGSGAIGGNSDGVWKISSFGGNASLILQFNNGSARQFAISRRQASNEIGLNGKRFFVQNHNQCN